MIYLDTSVALATLLAEDRSVPASFWSQPFVASRLFEYELRTRFRARGGAEDSEDAETMVGLVTLIELSPVVLERALHPFPTAVRTLDALHLATAHYLHTRRAPLRLATFDRRLAEAATSIGLPLADVG